MRDALTAAIHLLAALGLVMIALGAPGCSVGVRSMGKEYRVAVFDKLEGQDAQVEHNKAAGMQVGSVVLGVVERDIFRVPGAKDAEVETTTFLNAHGQAIRTTVKTRIGQYTEE